MSEYKGITMSLISSGAFDDIQLEHDDREYDENGKPYFSDNVDVSRSGDNWYYENNMSVEEFYEREFGEEYRQQQQRNIDNRHPERNKYSSYYEEVMTKQLEAEAKVKELRKKGMSKKDIKREMAATTKVAYQMIVQLGDNKGDFRTVDNTPEQIELGKNLLIDFIRDFEKKYPNMKIINAAIHCDEIGKGVKDKETGKIVHPGGTIHAHITTCPVSRGYKKGMSARNSLTKTLTDMGFEDDKVKNAETGEFQFGIEKWQQKMREDFNEHIQKFGYTRIEPAEKSDTHDDISTFQKKQEQKKIVRANDERISEQQKEIASANTELETIGEQVVSAQDDLRRTRLEKRRIEGEHEEKIAGLTEKKKQLETDTEAISKKNKEACDYHTRIKTANEKQDNKYNQNKPIVEKLEERYKKVKSRWLDYECNMISAIKNHWLYKKLAKKFQKVEHLYEIEQDRKKMNDVYAYDNRDFGKSGYTPKQILEWQEYFNGLAQDLHEEYKEYYKEMETPSIEDVLDAETPDIYTPSQVQDAIDMMNAFERGDDDFEIGG